MTAHVGARVRRTRVRRRGSVRHEGRESILACMHTFTSHRAQRQNKGSMDGEEGYVDPRPPVDPWGGARRDTVTSTAQIATKGSQCHTMAPALTYLPAKKSCAASQTMFHAVLPWYFMSESAKATCEWQLSHLSGTSNTRVQARTSKLVGRAYAPGSDTCIGERARLRRLTGGCAFDLGRRCLHPARPRPRLLLAECLHHWPWREQGPTECT